jgi:hypothetical protein
MLETQAKYDSHCGVKKLDVYLYKNVAIEEQSLHFSCVLINNIEINKFYWNVVK